MAAYAISRQRTLLGKTYSFVQRRRGVAGLGDAAPTPPDFSPAMNYIDMTTGIAYDYPCPSCGPGFLGPAYNPLLDPLPSPAKPPFVFTDSKPTPPRQVITPVTAPNIGPGPSPVQIVFPSAGAVSPPAKYAAPAVSWLDQQMISGVPNSYLALATAGLVLFVSISGAKRRR